MGSNRSQVGTSDRASSTDHRAAAMPVEMRDGYEALRAALRYGLDVSLYPRQVLMASVAGGDEVAYVHGIPDSSNLAAVTYAQDKHMRRELLARAGLPVPPGATFAIGTDVKRAKQFAQSIGYPVVVQPAVGDNMIEVLPAANEKQLTRAIDYLRTPETERPTFTRTAYALTLLLEPDEEDGRLVAPAKYRFMIERQVAGQRLRLLVVDGEAMCTVLMGTDPAAPPQRDVTDEVHPSLLSLAVTAANTIPGLAVVTLDLTVTDYGQPADAQDVHIVDFSERPLLATQAALSDDLAHRLGEEILLRRVCGSGVRPAPRDEVAVEFSVEGLTNPHSGVAAIVAAGNDYGLVGDLRIIDQVEGAAGGRVQGAPDQLAMLFERLVAGTLDGERAMLVRARQIPMLAESVHCGSFQLHVD